MRLGERRVARRSSGTLQPDLVGDLAQRPDARIDIGDVWLVSLLQRPTLRHLYASARRLLLEHTSATVYLHYDHLGSVISASGPAAAALGECAFDITGEPREAKLGHVDPYGFTGQRRDPTTNLLHVQARELDPIDGRWLSPDPLLLSDSRACLARPFECANGYQYVLNNPVDAIDPTGNATVWIRHSPGRWPAFAISRDGVDAEVVSPGGQTMVPVGEVVNTLLALRPTVVRAGGVPGELSGLEGEVLRFNLDDTGAEALRDHWFRPVNMGFGPGASMAQRMAAHAYRALGVPNDEARFWYVVPLIRTLAAQELDQAAVLDLAERWRQSRRSELSLPPP
ncbi:MAG: RHS repeat-associated core domain-containing protein [Myxococcales bacterium]